MKDCSSSLLYCEAINLYREAIIERFLIDRFLIELSIFTVSIHIVTLPVECTLLYYSAISVNVDVY